MVISVVFARYHFFVQYTMPTRVVHVAVTQAEPAWLDLGAGVEKTCGLIQEAANNKAELVAFPECFIPGYPAWIW